ncbi:fasciculation and elongation protein zeta-2 isoform X2 [Anarrhichthys ocellatus]|uniref:fasciculation and elongation protein zeta-2 isoform X2 n=1 Tax=Anarrhichthys ocellatus TaxID=433405 RepID=UPI0012ECF012|nr:tetranectin isoform X2 [Anarrhichthys ocellatus]
MAAPVAHFDDGWPLLGDLSMVSDRTLLPHKGRVAAAGEAAPRLLLDDDGGIPELRDSGFSPGETTGAFRSMEDLVNDFDEKLSVCFGNFNAKTDSIAPVTVITEDSLLEKDELWKVLSGNYGRVMPVDWKQSRTCALHVPTFNLEEKPRKTDVTAELSDDEELREQLDMHSIIVSCLAEEPLFTAEQVIEEIEEMMQDSPDTEAGPNPSQSDLSMLSLDVQRATRSPSYESRVRTLSVAELNESLEETETNIRMFSEELVQQLALRDELDFEKEVKNSFISALIDVQNRQKEHRELLKKKKKLKGGAGTSQGHAEKTLGSYLTTVIPYEKKGHPPSLEDLQILTKILQAMRDDSDKVPSLLTDYILKDSANSAAIEELKKQITDIVQELNLLKEQQALHTVCLRGTKVLGKCFLADPLKKTFHAASEDCIAKGGTLSTPLIGDENDQLYNYVRQSIGPEEHIWLGVNDMVTEGQWVDQSGSSVRFKNWETEITLQPDGGRSQNCGILSTTANGKWFDESCRAEKASVCEFNII